MTSTAIYSKLCLDGLPTELVDKIAEDLDLDSIRNLRLACKALHDRSYGPRFRSYFETQQTDLSVKSLERLCQIARHSRLGSAVQSLVVLAVVYDTSEIDHLLETGRRRVFEQQGVFSITTEPTATEELDEAKKNREQLCALMQEQQAVIRNESGFQLLADALRSLGKLAILEVEAAVVQEPGKYGTASSTCEWHRVWVRATQVYRTVTLAIAGSGIAVDALHFYKSSRKCSVPTWDVNEHMPALESAGFAQAAKHIKSISLSVSTKVETDYRKIADARANLSEVDRAYFEADMGSDAGLLSEDDLSVVAEGNFPGVARLLKPMSNLERLELHLYKTLRGGTASYSKVFSCIADDVVLPSLRHVILRGLDCEEASMLAFLHTHDTILTLEMREIHFVSGSWASIFAHLCTMPSLQEVTLQNIWGPNRMTSLAPRSPPREVGDREWSTKSHSFPCLGGGSMVHTRTFSRAEMEKEKFEFAKRPNGRQLGSPDFHRWITSRRAEYGPP